MNIYFILWVIFHCCDYFLLVLYHIWPLRAPLCFNLSLLFFRILSSFLAANDVTDLCASHCPSPGVSHFFKEHWFFSLKNSI